MDEYAAKQENDIAENKFEQRYVYQSTLKDEITKKHIFSVVFIGVISILILLILF